MGKKSKRPARAARDVHSIIRADAEALKATTTSGVYDADQFPELAALLHAGREAISAGVPRFVLYKGRNYWLRVRLAVQLDVFAQPGDAEPLVRGMAASTEDHGHAPGH